MSIGQDMFSTELIIFYILDLFIIVFFYVSDVHITGIYTSFFSALEQPVHRQPYFLHTTSI